ncbi:MAG: PilC/PilY family type IV pilus protein, partial [Pseudomonadota bacterium]
TDFGPEAAVAGNALAFDAGLYYRLGKDASGAWLDPRKRDNYLEYSVNRAGGFRKFPARTDCAGSTCTQAEERQNFANWFVYHRSRLLAAKAGLGQALYEVSGPMRLGWGRMNKGPSLVDGQSLSVLVSGVRDYTAARKAEVMRWLYGIAPFGSTPTREVLHELGRYLRSTGNGGPWSDDPGGSTPTSQGQSCRRAFHVLVTDGDWSGGGKDGTGAPANNISVTLDMPGNSDGEPGDEIVSPAGRTYKYLPTPPYRDQQANMLADFAMELWKRDLQPDIPNNVTPSADNPSFWQNLTQFTVGFGVRGLLDPAKDWPALQDGSKTWVSGTSVGIDAKIDDLWHTAVNSRGAYSSARNATDLNASLAAALVGASSRERMEAGVATASSVLEANNRKYVPSYKPSTWSGDVVALQLDAAGQAGTQLWSARKQMPDWTSRRIVTWDAGGATPQGVPFDWSNLSAAARSAFSAVGGSALVDYVRGDRSREDAATGFRVREHVLGDFVNTSPVLAGGTATAELYQLPDLGKTYSAYVNGIKSARPGVLWVGGNDGMLHAFRDGRGVSPQDGREIFAYVPRAVWGKLSALARQDYGGAANPHQYFVDGPLREADVYVRASGAATAGWRNYLFGSTGAGARAVFALDITNPDALGAASVRWEISSDSQPELGHVLFPIESGPLPDGRWVAVFGNGYGGDSGKALLFVVDVASGAVSRLPVAEATAGNGLGGVTALRNASGQIVRLYAGDLAGQLWRFDYDAGSASGFKVGHNGKPLFRAPPGQAVLQPPAVFAHGQSGQVVVFGTGRLITADDLVAAASQSIYGVRDTDAGVAQVPWTAADLLPRQLGQFANTVQVGGQGFLTLSGSALDWRDKPGWRIDLELGGFTGLRVIYPPQKASAGFALVSAVSPASSGLTCESAVGRAINLLIPVMTGATSSQPVFDTTGDGI